jgi:hypothetical protein
MLAYFGNSILICQLFNQKYKQSGQIYASMEHQTIVYYSQ